MRREKVKNQLKHLVKPGNLVVFEQNPVYVYFENEHVKLENLNLRYDLEKSTRYISEACSLKTEENYVLLYLDSKQLYEEIYKPSPDNTKLDLVGFRPVNWFIHSFLYNDKVCFIWSMTNLPKVRVIHENKTES